MGNPLKVIVAGAGGGGLVFASSVRKCSEIDVVVVEKASKFKRFGGPIQLASNALQVLKEMDGDDGNIYDEIMSVFTNTGDKTNGIKDGIRDDWYAKFDLKSPAEQRNMPYTGVIDRPDIIIKGFDTPCKVVYTKEKGLKFENFGYAGVVTKIMQPILPIFFTVQFAFLYDGYKNKKAVDLAAGLGLFAVGSVLLILGGSIAGETSFLAGLGLGLGFEGFENAIQGITQN